LLDFMDEIMLQLAKVEELTPHDRKIINEALAFVQQQMDAPSEVYWPIPHPAMEGPHGEAIWLSNWLAKRAGARR
jgi:hypothetical protein